MWRESDKKMTVYEITVTVDEDVLKESSGTDDIAEAIEQEMNWVAESGIYFDTAKEVKK